MTLSISSDYPYLNYRKFSKGQYPQIQNNSVFNQSTIQLPNPLLSNQNKEREFQGKLNSKIIKGSIQMKKIIQRLYQTII